MKAIRWTMTDIKGINQIIVQYRIYLIEETKPTRDPQYRLNPIIKEVLRKDILKCLDNGIIISFPVAHRIVLSKSYQKNLGSM